MFRHQQPQRPARPAQRPEHPLARQRSLWRLSNTPSRSPAQILALHIARTAPVIAQRVPVVGSITTVVLSPSHALLGDSRGWLYTAQHRQWVIDSSLGSHSEISSLNIALDAFSLATSFGPSSKIRVQKLADPNLSCLITPRGVHDIRCSHYSTHPDQAIIGAKNHAVYITDIFNQPRSTFFHTHSDVFSLTRQHDLVYAGTRNGSIHRFDLRIPPPPKNRVPATIIFPNSSTVLYMQPIHDVYFLSSYMNGQILMYDIRFPKSHPPVLRFPGHVNTYTPRLIHRLLFSSPQARIANYAHGPYLPLNRSFHHHLLHHILFFPWNFHSPSKRSKRYRVPITFKNMFQVESLCGPAVETSCIRFIWAL